MLQRVEDIRQRIGNLQIEHRDLDAAIASLAQSDTSDDLTIRRLKKRKLQIKDEITALQMRLTPDVPA